ncbi:MAG: hypothetical protein JO142_00155, partial [Burkholderiales bacterium]|nr:hypothetical protein [Burkholderiales bacterium]
KARSAGGRTIVLTTSFADTAQLAERLGTYGVIAHQRDTKLSACIARYKTMKRAVLITPAGWEGIDLPGLVQHLVIARLPFAAPNSVESEIAELDLLRRGTSPEKVASVLAANQLERAKRKLAQGLGRAIRAYSDRATVWIADVRFPLPEEMATSLDPLILNAPAHTVYASMRECISRRFIPSYNDAPILLADGKFYATRRSAQEYIV